MEIPLVLLLAAIGGAIIRVDRTLLQVNRNLEQIALALKAKQ
jgi:hypothetical protein